MTGDLQNYGGGSGCAGGWGGLPSYGCYPCLPPTYIYTTPNTWDLERKIEALTAQVEKLTLALEAANAKAARRK